ncbi:MAG: succinyl-diaminopimelate desuccinylase [Hyphomicrobiales bacterium]
MTPNTTPGPLEIAQALIRCPSVTPVEGGALDYLERLLGSAGFTCRRLKFSDKDTPDVDNLFARIGSGSPHICFAGHTDVVPPGNAALWTHPPFSATVADGVLYGRGAVDMKGAVACFAAATLGYLKANGGRAPGSISFLITGDEESVAINGTRKVLDWMARNGHTPDHCIVGEPSNPKRLGDEIKIGRRGSVSAKITVTGKQGHSAYPQLANNPVPGMVKLLASYMARPLDKGTKAFEPSHIAVTALETNNTAFNVIPAAISAKVNIRFNTKHTADGLLKMLRDKARAALKGTGLKFTIEVEPVSHPFLTESPDLIGLMQAAVKARTRRSPKLSTGGGTSDARFIKDHCPVIEFGLVNRTIHQVDERTPVPDLTVLTEIYGDFLARYFSASSGQVESPSR